VGCSLDIKAKERHAVLGHSQSEWLINSSALPPARWRGSTKEKTMEVIEIKNRWSGEVLYSGEHASLKEAVEAVVKAGADLTGADLADANLRGANLCDANLRGADLGGAKVGQDGDEATLVGSRPVVQIGPIGSRSDWLLVFWCGDAGVRISAGCQRQISESYFLERLADAHGEGEQANIHAQHYIEALAFAKRLLKDQAEGGL
jgi:hypothetical protein